MARRACTRFAPAAALLLALLGGTAALQAQQPGRPVTQPPRPTAQPVTPPAEAAPQDTTKPKDPRLLLLERLRRLDAPPDTASRDTTAADSAQGGVVEVRTSETRQAGGAAQMQLDSVMKELVKFDGFTATQYTGKAARFVADTGRLILTGPAQVAQGAQAMTADSTLIYNQNTQIACGYGKPVLTGAGQSNPVESDQVCYDVGKRMGVAFGARTKFQEGATAWYVDGHKVYTSGADNLFGRDAEFTDCDLKEPHYHFTAKELKMVKGKVLVARDVTLSFADVPVFWLPFMVQSMQQGRRSGILMPRFSLNDIAPTNRGYQRRIENVGAYWAINDHLGSLVTLDWFANSWTALHGAFDYSFRRSFLDGGLDVRRYWRQNGTKELTLGARNSWRPDERTNLQFNAQYSTSSSFVRAQSFDPFELNRSIDSNLAMQRRFDWGSLDISGHRRQMLSNDRVTMTLPTVSLSLTPLTLIRRSDGSPLLSWNSSGNFTSNRDDAPSNPLMSSEPSRRSSDGSFNSSLNFGPFSWTQTVSYGTDRSLLRPSFLRPGSGTKVDTVPAIGAQARNQMDWSTSLSFQQRLIGTSQLTPQLQITGQSMSIDTGEVRTGMIARPLRMNFGVGTSVDMYGFWPGVGPFTRIRHKFVPNFSYTYSPAADSTRLTDMQKLVFGRTAGAISETNYLTVGLNQTFEAKYRESEKDSTQSEAQDTTTNLDGEPRRLKQSKKLMLLSIQTSAVTYDFTNDPITGRRIGFKAPQVSNSIRSDIIPGLQFNLTHDIFRYDSAGTTGPRHFSPFLTNASTSFALDSKSWLFRLLGMLTGGGSSPAAAQPSGAQAQAPGEQDSTRATLADEANNSAGLGVVGGGQRIENRSVGGPVGSWSGNFTYTLRRDRPTGLHNNLNQDACSPIFGNCGGGFSSQMVQADFRFQPTQSWAVTWRTSYDFTQHTFADHFLTLTRDLHDWEAHFDFVKAQNGNFTFQFRVNLKAQPDLKFDYRQVGGDAYQRANNSLGY